MIKDSQKYTLIITHILAWAICLSIPVFIYNNPYGEFIANAEEKFGIPETIAYITFICFFYLNAFVLLPKLFSQKKIVAYIVITFLLLIIVATTNATIASIYRAQVPPRPFIRVWAYRVFISLANLALSTSYRLIMDNFKREQFLKEKEKENLIAELSFLRSQISPHFVFNVLNSVVSLVRKKSDQAEPVLMELSNLMRYMLYESDAEKVSVTKMIMYLTSYINLQKMRFGDDIKLDFKIENNTVNDHYIEPMLFIPLVENAFKHGIGIVEHPEIRVVLKVSGQSINLYVSNKYDSKTKVQKDKKSGIGLNNLKRRLDLLYQHKHQFAIIENENEFTATLNIQLQ